jgi:hypothetical protein
VGDVIKRRNETGPRREEEETGRGCSAGAVGCAMHGPRAEHSSLSVCRGS